jgi:G:T-mismatch repair DNA endonuclease (very short patch repair protein)
MAQKISREERKTQILEKRKQTNLLKFGTPFPSQSKKCQEKYKKTCLEKYGVENISQLEEIKNKKIKTCMEHFGVEHPQQSQKIREKRVETYKKNYGVENPTQSEEIKEKTRKICMEKYGVKSTNQLQEVKEKKKKTCKIHYGVENPSQSKEIQEKMREYQFMLFYKKLFQSNRLKGIIKPLFPLDEYSGVKGKEYSFECLKCGNKFIDNLNNARIPRCYKCYPIEKFTKPHKAICEYLEEKNINFIIEKYISPYSVDIFIEPNKIIEVYGDYWHGNPKFYEENSDLSLPWGKIKVEEKWEKDKNREEYLKKQGYEILTIWENDINTGFEIVNKQINQFLEIN